MGAGQSRLREKLRSSEGILHQGKEGVLAKAEGSKRMRFMLFFSSYGQFGRRVEEM
jgi:hypothetical protein